MKNQSLGEMRKESRKKGYGYESSAETFKKEKKKMKKFEVKDKQYNPAWPDII